MQYDWIDFYTEFATKLLHFKTDRKTLIQKIYAVYDATGISVPKLESGDEIIDIDPFTIFGTFNKGITNANRIAILNGIASEFEISATVPSNFDGIPVLNNLKATFYGFKDDRKANDIDNLWSLFEVALVLADNDTEDNRQKFSNAYNKVHDQLCIRWNITMALYWIRPYTFINLDSRNRWFISNAQNMLGEFVVAAEKKLKKVPYAADYLEIKDLCKKVLEAGQYEYKSFPDLSYMAWVISEKVNQEKSIEKGKKTSKAEFLKWFIPQTEAFSSLRGKIDIAESIKTQSMLRKQLICTYDEFSVNSTMNQIIKSTVELLLCSNISKKRKKNLRKLMIYFGEVDFIDLHTVNWNVQYNRNNQTYRMLISICYLVVKGLLQTQSDGSKKLMDFLDEQRMCRLYEKFILEYYRKEFKNQIAANASQIPWQLDNEENAMLPVMQSDIMLQRGDRVLIIDAKYYEHSMQVQFNKHTLHSANLYQIFTYVKNKEYELREKEHTVSGMLLYAKTDEEIYPNNVYQMSGNQITVRTLDLNLPFTEIAEQLDTIAKLHFSL